MDPEVSAEAPEPLPWGYLHGSASEVPAPRFGVPSPAPSPERRNGGQHSAAVPPVRLRLLRRLRFRPAERGRGGEGARGARIGTLTGWLTAVGSVLFTVVVVTGHGDPASDVFPLGLPCAVGLLAGARTLRRAGRPRLLRGSAWASIAVLLAVSTAGSTRDRADFEGVLVIVAIAVVFPIVTLVRTPRRPRRGPWSDPLRGLR